MCIIVVKPVGKKLDKALMKNCWEHNGDGAGFMIALDNKIIIKKELTSFNKIWKKYNNLVIKPGLEEKKNVVFHFRIQTHGKIDEDNCHPFYINNGQHMAFCHNGTITNIKADRKDSKSDTVQFRDKILNHLPKNWMKNPAMVTLVYEYISYNKLAFLFANGNVNIMNKSKGEESDGIWYSNSSYKDRTVTVHNIHDKRNNGFGYQGGYAGGWQGYDDYGDGYYNNRSGIKSRDSKGIKDNIKAATTTIDNPLLTITDVDTIAEIYAKMSKGGIVDESPVQTKLTELTICRRCSIPLAIQKEVTDKKCTWCAANEEENALVYGSEDSSGYSRSQLH